MKDGTACWTSDTPGLVDEARRASKSHTNYNYKLTIFIDSLAIVLDAANTRFPSDLHSHGLYGRRAAG